MSLAKEITEELNEQDNLPAFRKEVSKTLDRKSSEASKAKDLFDLMKLAQSVMAVMNADINNMKDNLEDDVAKIIDSDTKGLIKALKSLSSAIRKAEGKSQVQTKFR